MLKGDNPYTRIDYLTLKIKDCFVLPEVFNSQLIILGILSKFLLYNKNNNEHAS